MTARPQYTGPPLKYRTPPGASARTRKPAVLVAPVVKPKARVVVRPAAPAPAKRRRAPMRDVKRLYPVKGTREHGYNHNHQVGWVGNVTVILQSVYRARRVVMLGPRGKGIVFAASHVPEMIASLAGPIAMAPKGSEFAGRAAVVAGHSVRLARPRYGLLVVDIGAPGTGVTFAHADLSALIEALGRAAEHAATEALFDGT